MIAWRIVEQKQIEEALTCTGASQFSSRWNSKGTKIVYAASSKSQAIVEVVVNLGASEFRKQNFVYLPLFIPASVSSKKLLFDSIPSDWNSVPLTKSTQEIGDKWVTENDTCICIVPSVLVPGEEAILINPLHADFSNIIPLPIEDYTSAKTFDENYVNTIINNRDIFICHASEDKETVVRPLYTDLTINGISCWFDEAEIFWGDSITKKVNEGLKNSKYVIVVLSRDFLKQNWPQKELNAALSKEASSGQKIVLPLIVGTNETEKKIRDEFILQNDKLFLKWTGSSQPIIEALKKIIRR